MSVNFKSVVNKTLENTIFENYVTIIVDLDKTLWDCTSVDGSEIGAFETESPYELKAPSVIIDIKGNIIRLQDGVRDVLKTLDAANKNVGIVSSGEKLVDLANRLGLPFEAQPSVMLLKKFDIFQYFNYDIILKAFADKGKYVRSKGKTLFIDDNQEQLDSVIRHAEENNLDLDVLSRTAFKNWKELLEGRKRQSKLSWALSAVPTADFDDNLALSKLKHYNLYFINYVRCRDGHPYWNVLLYKDFEGEAFDLSAVDKLLIVKTRIFSKAEAEQLAKAAAWSDTSRGAYVVSYSAKTITSATAGQAQALFICFYVPDVIKGRLGAIKDLEDNLHVTLLYYPDAKITDDQLEELKQAIAKFYEHCELSIKCSFTGIAEFDSKDTPVVALVNMTNGAEFRTRLKEIVASVITLKESDYDFIPHVTLSYTSQKIDSGILKDINWIPEHIGMNVNKDNYFSYSKSGKVIDGKNEESIRVAQKGVSGTEIKKISFKKLALDKEYWLTYIPQYVRSAVKGGLATGLGNKDNLAKDAIDRLLLEIPDSIKQEREFISIFNDAIEKLEADGYGDYFAPRSLSFNTPPSDDAGDQAVNQFGEAIDEDSGEINFNIYTSPETSIYQSPYQKERSIDTLLDQLHEALVIGDYETATQLKVEIKKLSS